MLTKSTGELETATVSVHFGSVQRIFTDKSTSKQTNKQTPTPQQTNKQTKLNKKGIDYSSLAVEDQSKHASNVLNLQVNSFVVFNGCV